MPSKSVSPAINLVTSTKQAAGPTMATTAVADQPAASNSRRGIQRHVGTNSRERAAASSHGIQASHGAKPWPAAPGHMSPSVPPSAHHVLITGYGSASTNAA